MHPQTSSPFFHFPREVRDMIYTEVISGLTVFVDHEDSKPYNIGFILACEQTYAETIKLFYKTTTFSFEDVDAGIDFVTAIPEKYRKLITDVEWDIALEDMDCDILENGHSMDKDDLHEALLEPLLSGLKANRVKMNEEVFRTSMH